MASFHSEFNGNSPFVSPFFSVLQGKPSEVTEAFNPLYLALLSFSHSLYSTKRNSIPVTSSCRWIHSGGTITQTLKLLWMYANCIDPKTLSFHKHFPWKIRIHELQPKI